MRRRRLLAATGTALAVGTAGCGLFGSNETNEDSNPESPEAAAESFVEALITGNDERAQELRHPESPSGFTAGGGGTSGELTSLDSEVLNTDLSFRDAREYEDAGIVADVTQVEQAALVRVPFEAEIDGEQVDTTFLIVAAKQDDGWLVLDRGVPRQGEPSQ